MPIAAAHPRRGRRGRRSAAVIRTARERIDDLFAQAGLESTRNTPSLPDRYVRLARRIGARYNVRLLPEYRELYCRGCSTFWREGATVRTRLRGGTRVRTCLVCGRIRRVAQRRHAPGGKPVEEVERPVRRPDMVLVGPESDEELGDRGDEEQEE